MTVQEKLEKIKLLLDEINQLADGEIKLLGLVSSYDAGLLVKITDRLENKLKRLTQE